uniref:Uncharacterized protein n=1 Tax=Pseudomonas putida TaxID=303 RepID=A0A2Z1CAT9_PSEPU|nr:Hypothetical protein [Pseudomonas putida]
MCAGIELHARDWIVGKASVYAGGGLRAGAESWTEPSCAPLAWPRVQVQIVGEASVLVAAGMQLQALIVDEASV